MPGFDSADVVDFVERNGNLLCATKYGIMLYEREQNKIKGFSKGLLLKDIRKIAIDRDGVIYAAASNGLHKTYDNGKNWELIHTPDFFYLPDKEIFCSRSGTLFLKTEDKSLVSTDKGANWRELEPDYNEIKIVAEDDQGRLYGMNSAIIYSDDGGLTWQKLTVKDMGNSGVATIAAYKDRIAIGSNKNGVFYSADQGATFQKLPLTVDENGLNICRFNSRGDLFVVMTSQNNAGAIYRSTDGCATFKKLRNIKDFGFNVFRIDSSGYIYMQGKNVFGFETKALIRSRDNGETWEDAGVGDSLVVVTDICFGANNDAYLSTLNNGVFATDEVKSMDYSSAVNTNSIVISPNPANDIVTFRFEKTDSPVSVIVYNQLGEAVLSTVRSGVDGALILRTNELPIGSYTAVAIMEDGVLSGRFLILR